MQWKALSESCTEYAAANTQTIGKIWNPARLLF